MKFNWGSGIFLFFVIFVGLATVFIVFSFRQQIDLVTEDYYNEGAAYTQQMKINERSAKYKDSILFSLNRDYVIMQLTPTLASDASNLETYFYYPANKQNDYTVSFDHLSDADSLLINKSKLAKGRYIVKISWELNADRYYSEQTLFID